MTLNEYEASLVKNNKKWRRCVLPPFYHVMADPERDENWKAFGDINRKRDSAKEALTPDDSITIAVIDFDLKVISFWYDQNTYISTALNNTLLEV